MLKHNWCVTNDKLWIKFFATKFRTQDDPLEWINLIIEKEIDVKFILFWNFSKQIYSFNKW